MEHTRKNSRTLLLAVLGLAFYIPMTAFAQNLQATPEYQQSARLLGAANFDGAISALQPLMSQAAYAAAAKIEVGNIRKRQAEMEMAQATTHFHEAANNLYDGIMAGGIKGSESSKLLYELSQMFEEKLNDYQKAIELYAKIVQDYPTFLSIDKVTYHLALCNERLGRSEEAAKNYKELIEKYPYSSFLQTSQERLKSLAPGTAHAKAAIEVQENMVENAKSDSQANKATMDLAAMYVKEGDYRKAIEEYKKIAADATSPELAREAYQKMAGLMDEKEKDYKGAAGALEEMVNRFPNEPGNEKNLYKLGRIYEENLESTKTRVRGDQVLYKKDDENVKKAIDYYNRITENTPDADVSADAYLRKGTLYEERLKDPEEARKNYSEFLRRFPDHPEAEKIREKMKALEEE